MLDYNEHKLFLDKKTHQLKYKLKLIALAEHDLSY